MCLKRSDSTHALTQRIFCSKCGIAFRRLTTCGKIYWVTSIAEKTDCPCRNHRLKESAIYDVFSLLTYKMKVNQESLLIETIHQMEQLIEYGGENTGRISEIDKEIAQLCAQKHVLTKLKNNGILASVDYAKQASDIENKVSALRTERRIKLYEDQDDRLLDELKRLTKLIEETKPTPVFNETLFEQIVKRIDVIDNATIRIKLLGDITITETIAEKARCRNI